MTDPIIFFGPEDFSNPDYVRALNAYIDALFPETPCPACGEDLARDEELRYCVTDGCPLNPFEQENNNA